MTESQQEKRQFIRREVRWQVAIKNKKTVLVIEAMTINISEQGVLIASREGFQKGELISLIIKARYQGIKRVIYTMAELRHIVIKKDSFQLGFLFKNIQPDDQNFLAQFVEEFI